MNVFILCTGRSGSMGFIRACEYIENFTCGHETRARYLGDERINYPSEHIEADNRLSWLLGQLDKKYGKNAFYIHLKRDEKRTISSFKKRWANTNSIIKAFSNGILNKAFYKLDSETEEQVISYYYHTVNDNIELFLKDKPKTLTIDLEEIESGFRHFWKKIDAQGDFEKAVASFRTKENTTKPYNFASIIVESLSYSAYKIFFTLKKLLHG